MDEPEVPPADQTLLEQAVRWSREAGALTLEHFRSPELEVHDKPDGSPVTVADRAAERLLRDRISTEHPRDSILGEEHDDHRGDSGRTWVIDPIDGTAAFTHGVGTYSNLLYFEDGYGPAIGVINLPALGETVWAGRGLGCHLNGERREVLRLKTDSPGSPDELAGSVLCTTGFHCWTPTMFERVQAAGVSLRTWGDAYGYALVATGRAAAMFDPLLQWWDLAAVMVVIEEAGGTITRSDGGPELRDVDLDAEYPYSAIASGQACHDDWVRILSAG